MSFAVTVDDPDDETVLRSASNSVVEVLQSVHTSRELHRESSL
jgi:hypothetical protein